ncbi:hypothetical protein VZT92_000113 [Zoarces viviparus]|uniref:Uncharacterized protein n=1 Tax=Zoarces viviparus TaxID=48416 RepID=A0AAW1G4N5_ZOAVI
MQHQDQSKDSRTHLIRDEKQRRTEVQTEDSLCLREPERQKKQKQQQSDVKHRAVREPEEQRCYDRPDQTARSKARCCLEGGTFWGPRRNMEPV